MKNKILSWKDNFHFADQAFVPSCVWQSLRTRVTSANLFNLTSGWFTPTLGFMIYSSLSCEICGGWTLMWDMWDMWDPWTPLWDMWNIWDPWTPLWDMQDMLSVASLVRYVECGLHCEICKICWVWTPLWDIWSVGIHCEICEIS